MSILSKRVVGFFLVAVATCFHFSALSADEAESSRGEGDFRAGASQTLLVAANTPAVQRALELDELLESMRPDKPDVVIMYDPKTMGRLGLGDAEDRKGFIGVPAKAVSESGARNSVTETYAPDFWGAVFRQLGFMGQDYRGPDQYEYDGYKPHEDRQIVGGKYDAHYEQFAQILNGEFAANLKTQIDRDRIDQRVIADTLTPEVRKEIALGAGLLMALLFCVWIFGKKIWSMIGRIIITSILLVWSAALAVAMLLILLIVSVTPWRARLWRYLLRRYSAPQEP
ncbi:MAG: hypothetical protein JKY34_09300 [Kordiimonadaceae bacterium]|nr:hypothetical protein [Kordiimonadaceae bacterium]